MATFQRMLLLTTLVAAAFATSASAQGIEVKRSASVLYGSASACTQPAVIDYDDVKKKTPEWKTIRSEGVRPGSARYSLLMSELDQRVQRLCQRVAQDEGRDCVVRKGEIKNDHGLEVADLTDKVVEAVENDSV